MGSIEGPSDIIGQGYGSDELEEFLNEIFKNDDQSTNN